MFKTGDPLLCEVTSTSTGFKRLESAKPIVDATPHFVLMTTCIPAENLSPHRRPGSPANHLTCSSPSKSSKQTQADPKRPSLGWSEWSQFVRNLLGESRLLPVEMQGIC